MHAVVDVLPDRCGGGNRAGGWGRHLMDEGEEADDWAGT